MNDGAVRRDEPKELVLRPLPTAADAGSRGRWRAVTLQARRPPRAPSPDARACGGQRPRRRRPPAPAERLRVGGPAAFGRLRRRNLRRRGRGRLAGLRTGWHRARLGRRTSLGSGIGISASASTGLRGHSPSAGSSSSAPPIGPALAGLDRLASSLAVGERRVGIPQKCKVPGIAAFGQRLPFERIARSGSRSRRRPRLRRSRPRPRRQRTRPPTGCRPSTRPCALRGGRSGPPCRSRVPAVLGDDDRRLLGLVVDVDPHPRRRKAFARKRAGSVFHGMMSIFSPRSSDTTMRTRELPTATPTRSTPCA